MIPAQIQTIVDQLGGQRIFAMAFDQVVYSTRDDDSQRPPSKGPASVSFSIAPRLRRAVKATHVVVDLEDSDTYTVSLWRNTNGISFKQTLTKRRELVHADNLRDAVEAMTGLLMGL